MCAFTQYLRVCARRKDTAIRNEILRLRSGLSLRFSLRVTYDRGKTWQQIVRIGSRLEGQIAIDPEEPSLMLVGAGGSVRRSKDGGHNWNGVSGPSGTVLGFHFDMTSPVSKRVCFAATRNGVWQSDNGGLSWTKKINGPP